MKREYKKACRLCIKCRFDQPPSTQHLCDPNCSKCSLGTTMIVPGGGLGSGVNANLYNIDFSSGVATISCYDNAGSGKCGSPLYYAGDLEGINYDAAIPLAYWCIDGGSVCVVCGVVVGGGGELLPQHAPTHAPYTYIHTHTSTHTIPIKANGLGHLRELR